MQLFMPFIDSNKEHKKLHLFDYLYDQPYNFWAPVHNLRPQIVAVGKQINNIQKAIDSEWLSCCLISDTVLCNVITAE